MTEVPNLHLHHLLYLREVARLGSISRAAEALELSQPALSQSLAEIERRTGVTLFERSGRRRIPTRAGAEVLAFAAAVLSRAETLQRALEGYQRGESGVLRAGMIDAAALYLLPEAIRAYRRSYPQVDFLVSVDSSDQLIHRLIAHELDLVVVVGDTTAQPVNVRSELLVNEPLYCYTHPDDTATPDAAQWVLYPAGSRTRRLIDAGLVRLGVTPVVTLESGNPQVLRQMVTIGMGRSVLPVAVAEAADAAVPLRRGAFAGERPVVAMVRAGAPLESPVQRLLELCRDYAGR